MCCTCFSIGAELVSVLFQDSLHRSVILLNTIRSCCYFQFISLNIKYRYEHLALMELLTLGSYGASFIQSIPNRCQLLTAHCQLLIAHSFIIFTGSSKSLRSGYPSKSSVNINLRKSGWPTNCTPNKSYTSRS
jgi:hypothetical protein